MLLLYGVNSTNTSDRHVNVDGYYNYQFWKVYRIQILDMPILNKFPNSVIWIVIGYNVLGLGNNHMTLI